MSFKTDQESLRKWFLETKREFPWRIEITPYRVWISEVMLQQTRADVVIDYFNRWMKLFPTLEDLKKAPLEKVLKAWEGLGYYSRARNIHKAAETLSERFPEDFHSLTAIKGIGPYTADALLSFAFQKKVIAVDANVDRVLSRYYASTDIKECKRRGEEELSSYRPFEIAEALIELGATICKKKADCAVCPLAQGCLANRGGVVDNFPSPKKRKEAQKVYKVVHLYECQNLFGIRKRGEKGLFRDLYLFEESEISEKEFLAICKKGPFKMVTSTATFYRFYLIANRKKLDAFKEDLEFFTLEECLKRPFSSGHRQILHQLASFMKT